MNGTLKTVLRVAFLVALIWILAAFVGAAPGASVRTPGFRASIGPRKKRGHRCRKRSLSYRRGGAVGEYIATNTGGMSMVGARTF